MKKIITILLASLLVMTQIVAFAAPIDNFNQAMTGSFSSGELVFTAGLTLNEEVANETDYLGLNSLNNATVTYRISYDIPSSTKTRMKVEVIQKQLVEESPNENKVTLWYDLDSTKPSLTYIMQAGGDPTYQYIKTEDMQVISGMKPPFDVTRVKSLEKNIFSKNKNSIKPTYKNSTYNLTLKDADMKNIAQTAVDELYEIIAPYFIGYASADAKAQFAAASVDVFKQLKNVALFDTNALVLKATVDNNKNLKAMNYEFHVNTDMAKVLGIITGQENFSSQSAPVDATVVLDYQYNNTNQMTVINLPELTEDNSVDVMAAQQQYQQAITENTVDKNEINVTVDNTLLKLDPKPIIVNDRTMVPVRALCNALGISNDAISFEDGVVIIYGSESVGYKTVQLTVDNNIALVNSEETTLDAPAVIVEDRMFIPLRFVSQAFGHLVEFTPFEDGTGSMITITKVVQNVASILIPTDSNNADKLFEIAKAVVGVNAEIIPADNNSFIERTNLMLAAGEPCIIYDNGVLDNAVVEKLAGINLFTSLDEALEKYAPDTLKAITDDETLKSAVTSTDGKIIAFPVTVNGKTVRLFVSSTVKDIQAVIALLDGFSKVASSMSSN